jgi:Methyltransferase domain
MYSKWRLTTKYLKYFFTSTNGKGHGIHSPFIYQFVRNVLNDKKDYPEYEKVEMLRKRLLSDPSVLAIDDFGAGSKVNNTNKRTVASIAKNTAKSKKFGQLLFRIVKEYKPETILELGTSLGITTSYFSLANKFSNLTTIEGAKEIADVAKKNFDTIGLQNINITQGNFDDTLPATLSSLTSLDFAFIDGNHRREPTERYFSQLLSKTNNESILVFDDIHWSKEMEEAWGTIKAHPSVRCTIDLFFIGIILFRQEFREKQHFCIRF